MPTNITTIQAGFLIFVMAVTLFAVPFQIIDIAYSRDNQEKVNKLIELVSMYFLFAVLYFFMGFWS